MKYNKKQKAMAKSYLRSLLVGITPLLAEQLGLLGEDPRWTYICAVAAAVLAVTSRYFDTTDKAFGRS